ncbi:MAG: hypothetical protein CME40_05255 [Haliea sp.]|nr:hypothetical protein [Haliea sp.]MAL94468.1 hypothetical protein [Haliea sp.]
MKRLIRGSASIILLLQGSAALADTGFIYDFSDGSATSSSGDVVSPISGDSRQYSSTVDYTESSFRMTVEPTGAVVTVGKYYSESEGVVHGHWSAGGASNGMDRLLFRAESGETFDLNYYVLTSNTENGGSAATGNEDTYIVASRDGVTASFRSKLPSEDWGISDGVREIYLGPEFDGIKAFWFESEGGTYCFGMDKFYVNLTPPPPSTPDPIVVGSGTVDDAIEEPTDSDGDGTNDEDDPFPNAVTLEQNGGSILETTPGTATSSCSIMNGSFNPNLPLQAIPAGITGIGRAIEFTLESCAVGESIQVSVDLGEDLLPGAAVYKINDAGDWAPIAGASVSGSVLTYTLTDGGPYDEDGIANGVIVDPVTVGYAAAASAAPQPVWTLPLWAIGMLGAGLSWIGASRMRKRS